jgi:ATP synthase protein I
MTDPHPKPGDDDEAERAQQSAALAQRIADARQAAGVKDPVTDTPAPGSAVPKGMVGIGLRLSLELVVALAIAFAIGFGIDKMIGTTPLFLLLMLPFGVAAAYRNLQRALTRLEEGHKPH